MKIDIYRDAKDRTLFYSFPAGADLSTSAFSSRFADKMDTIVPFKTHCETAAGRSYVALDAKDIEDQINSQGYAVHGVKLVWEELRGSMPQLRSSDEFLAEKHAETERENSDARF